MPASTPTTEIGVENYRFLQRHIYAQAGIVLENDKHYLFEARLGPIARQLGLGSINDLCTRLMAAREPEIERQVVEAMTTNETYFFRDPSQYEAIRTVLLPLVRQQRQDRKKLRCWSAAASSGQEAYSLAMLLREQDWSGWAIDIVGTDLSSRMVERARSGRYQQIEVNRGLPAALLVKHFSRLGMDWQISGTLRQMVRFDTLDLRQNLRTLGPFDLVFCRNVLIYFDIETRLNVLRGLHGTLFRGGWLLLGGAETAFNIDEWFERRSVGDSVVYIAR